MKLIGVLGGFIGIAILFALVHFVKMLVPAWFGVPYVIMCLGIGYLILLWIASKRPDLKEDDPNEPVLELPPAGATAVTGIYYLLPIVLLLWCILPTPDKLSAHLSAFYACLAMIFVALTQKPLKAMMRGKAISVPCSVKVWRTEVRHDLRRPQHDLHRHRNRGCRYHRRLDLA